MSDREHEIVLPFGILQGVAFYDGRREETKDGYKEPSMSYHDFSWEWHVDKDTDECVRAVWLGHSVRVLGAAVDLNKLAVYDYPGKCFMVHDFSRIWTMSRQTFQRRYVHVHHLLNKYI